MKKLSLTVWLLAAGALFAVQASALDGSGRVNDPYLLTDAEDWNAYAALVASGKDTAANVRLTNDISFASADFTPIGTDAHPFAGSFDGGCYTLSDISLENIAAGKTVNAVGIFPFASNAVFSNVRAENITVTVDGSTLDKPVAAGLLCGDLVLDGSAPAASFVDCAVNGSASVSADRVRVYVGGLAAFASSETDKASLAASDCFADVDLSMQSSRFVFGGGLFGMISLEAPEVSLHIGTAFAKGSVTTSGKPSMASLGGIAGFVTYEPMWSKPVGEASLSEAAAQIENVASAVTLSTASSMPQLGSIVGYTATAAVSNAYSSAAYATDPHAVKGTVIDASDLASASFLADTLGFGGTWTVKDGAPALRAMRAYGVIAVYDGENVNVTCITEDMPESICVAAFLDANGRLVAAKETPVDEYIDFAMPFDVKPTAVQLMFFENMTSLRPLLPAIRESISEAAVASDAQAYLLCHTPQFTNQKIGLESGWILDNRAGGYKASLETGKNVFVYDFSTDAASRLIRPLNHIANDVITGVFRFSLLYSIDGVSWNYEKEDGTVVYSLYTEDGNFKIALPDGTSRTLCPAKLGSHVLVVRMNLAALEAETKIDGVSYGKSPIASNECDTFIVSTDEESTNIVEIGSTYMFGNYCVTGESLTMKGETNATYDFDPASGKITMDGKFYFPDGADGLSVSLTSAGRPVATITAEDGKLYANGVSLNKTYSDKLWYALRITADTAAGTAKIYVNCAEKTTVQFLNDATSIDGLTVTGTAASNGIAFSGLNVFPSNDYEVPTPEIPAGAGRYTIGINVCPLWKNGDHWGWEVISPYDDYKPVLGYYDEGSPEVADWEIKYLADHGIDFESFCWYTDVSDGVICDPRFGSHLEDGFLYAKNLDYMKFSICWECSTAARPASEQAFYDYFVPYWVEYYFSNPHYMVLDNGGKGLLPFSIFGMYQLIYGRDGSTAFGTNLKRMFSYMNEEVKKLGYDGVLILVSNDAKNDLKAYGADAWHAYNWGSDGADANTMISRISNTRLGSKTGKDVYAIPTISIGFNNLPWNMESRSGLISVDGFRSVNYWVRDTYLPNYAKTDSVKWNDDLVWLSNWNEYGEGTYLMPSDGLNGFGYLDAIRWVYCTENAHTDVRPDAAQLKRITRAYPQNLRALMANGNNTGNAVPSGKTFANNADLYVNGVKLDAHIKGIVTTDGTFYYPFEPYKNLINYHLFVDYDWNYDTDALKLRRDGHEYVFTVGSSNVVVDGETRALGAVVYAIDNIPMLPMKQVCNVMGLRFMKSGSDYAVSTPEFGRVQSTVNSAAAVAGNWNFEGANSTLGFTMGSARVTAAPDYMHIFYDNGNDPTIMSADNLNVSCDKYQNIEICYRGKQNGRDDLDRMGFFFTTTTDMSYSESKHMTISSLPVDETEWKTATFEMGENANWKGTLKRLRFDMFEGGTGWLEIKYIRLVDADGKSPAVPYRLRGADASHDTNAFTGSGSYLTVEDDTVIPNDKVYQLTTASGKRWTYIIQNATLVPGQKYRIAFDVCVTGVGTVAEGVTLPNDQVANIFANIRYADPSQTGIDHTVSNVAVSKADGWVHYENTYTVKSTSTDRSSDQFAIFANPIGDHGVNYRLDNFIFEPID